MKKLIETMVCLHRIEFVISTMGLNYIFKGTSNFRYSISITSARLKRGPLTKYSTVSIIIIISIKNEFHEIFHSGTRRAVWLIDSYWWLPHVSLGSRILL